MANSKLTAFQQDKAKYNRASNYLKAAYLSQAMAVSYFNDFLDILKEFGLNQYEVKQQANRINKEFDRFYNLLLKNMGSENKLEFAKDFDKIRNIFDDIFDSDELVEIQDVPQDVDNQEKVK